MNRGYGIITNREGRTREFDMVCCGHCDRAIIIGFGIAVHRCTCCDRLICSRCVGRGCDPIEQKLSRMELWRDLSQG
jgi:hypothetical protein